MTPIELQHLEYIQSEVIPMTDEQKAVDHAKISIEFAIKILKSKSKYVHSADVTLDKIERLKKQLQLLKTDNNG